MSPDPPSTLTITSGLTVYSDLRPSLLRMLTYKTSDPELAEDLVQETWLRVMGALRRGACVEVSTAHHWLFRIATNIAYDALRRRQCVPMVSLDAITEQRQFVDDRQMEQEVALADALSQAWGQLLPKEQIILAYLRAESTIDAGARSMRLSRSAYQMRMLRARRHLATLLHDEREARR